MTTEVRRVVSGIRATGRMHLGNYLGALERFAKLSRDETKECFFFVADMHTLTTLKEAQKIREHTPNIILDMLAAGVDPERAIIYAQSDVPDVGFLTWCLSCLTPVSDMLDMPTYDEKKKKHADNVNGGLLYYPILMAADILGPHADMVPVGEDQMPHLYMTRDIARRFNNEYGQYFTLPDAMEAEAVLLPGLVASVPDEKGNTRFGKMGKSEASGETLYLSDSKEVMSEKLMQAPTDPARIKRTDPGNPEKCVIYEFHKLLSSGEQIRWAAEGCRTAGIGCRECKTVVAENVAMRLGEFHERRAFYAARFGFIEDVLARGAEVAQKIFAETNAVVAEKMGVYSGRSRA